MKQSKQMPPRGMKPGMDPEDMKEAPETPGETPDAEDQAEGPEPMGGIVASAMQPDAENPAEDASEPGEEPGEGDKPNASPEEQAMYDSLMAAAWKVMYNDEGIKSIITKLATGKDNESLAIGHTAAMILVSVKGAAEKQNKGAQIPDDVLMNVGSDIVSDLLEIAVGSGIVKPEMREKLAEAALYEGMRAYSQNLAQTGKLTPQMQADAQKTLADKGIRQAPPKQGAQSAPAAPQAGPAAPAPGGPPMPPQGGIVNQGMQS